MARRRSELARFSNFQEGGRDGDEPLGITGMTILCGLGERMIRCSSPSHAHVVAAARTAFMDGDQHQVKGMGKPEHSVARRVAPLISYEKQMSR